VDGRTRLLKEGDVGSGRVYPKRAREANLFMRPQSFLLSLMLVTLAAPVAADPVLWPSIGGREGEIDLNNAFVGMFGNVKPTSRESTWQKANTKLVTLGAGYSIGKLGPLYDCYARLEAASFVSAAERVESNADDLPAGYTFHPQDRGSYIRGTISANLAKRGRFKFGLYLQGTAPINVDFAKFSSVHLHWIGGGSDLEVALTDPEFLVSLHYRARMFVGSGAYSGDAQHNAEAQITNLLRVHVSRWLLPWPIGIAFGPQFAGDLNDHTNLAYDTAYGAVTPDLVAGDRVRSLSFALMAMPYIHLTKHVAIELSYQQNLIGTDLQATQIWTGGLRSAF
jgi:hypothetical protein